MEKHFLGTNTKARNMFSYVNNVHLDDRVNSPMESGLQFIPRLLKQRKIPSLDQVFTATTLSDNFCKTFFHTMAF